MPSPNKINLRESRDQALQDIYAELYRAERLHPQWPPDIFQGLAIIGEELGESFQAAIDAHFNGADPDRVYQEVLSVAATAMRFVFDYKVRPR